MLEIAKRQSQLESLNLSDNPTINDQVAEDLCFLFTSSSTMKHLYLDTTHITIKGLRLIIESIKESLKVRTISVQSCDLDLEGANGE